MSREIKFRAFINGFVVYGVSVHTNQFHIGFSNNLVPEGATDDFYKALEESEYGWWCLDGFDIMQYTGLKDRNGKEIYEGDIIRMYYGGEFLTGEIVWGDASFWIKYADGETEWLGEYDTEEDMRVIGNIHENPEPAHA